MHLYATYDGQEAREFVCNPVPSGGDWPEVAEQVQRVEVWTSHIDDPGDDHYVLIVFDADYREISRKRVEAY